MPPNAQRAVRTSEDAELEQATNEAIAACDGDLRGAIQALLIANEYLEQRNRELAAYISVGFVRGQLPANNVFEDGLKTDLDSNTIGDENAERT